VNIAVCLDDRNGLLFNCRRQSQDAVVRERLLQLAGEHGLWMNRYSAGQFESTDNITVDEAFPENVPAGMWCFVENTDICLWKDRIEKIAIYRWNRQYPSDVVFPVEEFEVNWCPVSIREFSGTSHERITEEIYQL